MSLLIMSEITILHATVMCVSHHSYAIFN